MNKNVKIAKELVKLAKNLIAEYNVADHEGEYENFTGTIDWNGTLGKVKNASFNLTKIYRGSICFKSGTWLDGTWKSGVWMNGTWENGNWEYGDWHGGTWLDGTWKDGGQMVFGKMVFGKMADGIWVLGKVVYGMVEEMVLGMNTANMITHHPNTDGINKEI